jgi:hypothetical protein
MQVIVTFALRIHFLLWVALDLDPGLEQLLVMLHRPLPDFEGLGSGVTGCRS